MRLENALRYENYLQRWLAPALVMTGDYILRRWCLYKKIPTITNPDIVLIALIRTVSSEIFRRYLLEPSDATSSFINSSSNICSYLIFASIFISAKYRHLTVVDKISGIASNPISDVFFRKALYYNLIVQTIIDQVITKAKCQRDEAIRANLRNRRNAMRIAAQLSAWYSTIRSHFEDFTLETNNALPLRYRQFKADVQADRTYFQALAVEENSTEYQIQRAYRNLALVIHPDKIPRQFRGNEEVVREFNALFNILTQAKNLCMESLILN